MRQIRFVLFGTKYGSSLMESRSFKMSELLRGERVQMMLTADELRAVDDWRFRRRMPSRASALREIIRIGLSAEGVKRT
jgi:hypothetical protein